MPDTYKFTRGATRQQMLDQMQTRAGRALVEEVWARRAPDLPIETPEEFVTLASIVEKETGQADERPRVAAVFINRLRKGMRLQSDPTMIYGLFGGAGKPPTGRSTNRTSRRRRPTTPIRSSGLPPTPIANPGRAALEAVANPSRTDELYFVADGPAGMPSPPTLDDHNRNVARWRRIEGRAGAGAGRGIRAGATPALGLPRSTTARPRRCCRRRCRRRRSGSSCRPNAGRGRSPRYRLSGRAIRRKSGSDCR